MLQTHPAAESRALPQHITDERNGLSYTLHGDYYFPDLELPEQQPIAPVDDDRRQGGVGSDVPAYLRRAPKR